MKKCPICNYENPSAARFCLSCGAPLSDEKLPEELILRKELEDARRTIVGLNNTIAELKESTEKSVEQETVALKSQIAAKEKKISELQASIDKGTGKDKVGSGDLLPSVNKSGRKGVLFGLLACIVIIVCLVLFILLRPSASGGDVEAFVDVNAGIQQATENISVKTKDLYGKIDGKAAEQPGKYFALQKETHEFEAECNKIFDGIRRIKVQCLNKIDETIDPTNIEMDTAVIKKMDDINAAPAIMDKEAGGVMGDSLRMWMDNFRNVVLKMSVFRIDKRDPNSEVNTSSQFYNRIAAFLDTSDKNGIPWEKSFVKDMPLAGTLALLSKLQSDIRNVEAEVLQQMVADIEGMDIRISSLTGLVSTSKSVVMSGSEYEAKIFIGARDTTMRPTIYVTQTAPYYDSVIKPNGEIEYKRLANATYDILPLDKQGCGTFKTVGGVGEHGYGGLIFYESNVGDQWIPYKSSYAVATSSTTISATACNIFYRGLQNPLSVAASGYTNINVSATGGATITKGKVAGYDGEYVVTIPANSTTKEVTINVSADGKSVGHQTFKVMNVPSPIITIGGYKSGDDLPKAAIKGSPRLDAVLEGGFFPFKDVKYTVTSFSYIKEVRGVTSSQVVSGNTIPGDILSDISKKASGSSISFIGIKVSSPSGPRNAPGFAARLK